MDKETISALFGWMPSVGSPNYRKIQADGMEYLQIIMPLGGFAACVCIPLRGRPDMTKPHGCETFLHFLRSQLEGYVQKHGTDEGFELSERDLEEIRDETLDFYRRRRFLLEAAAPAGEFGVVVSDGQHALELMDMREKYSPDRQRAWGHRKYEPYIRCHMIQAQVLLLLRDEDYRGLVESANKGISAMQEFDQSHEAWEYSDIDESVYPRSLIRSLRTMVLELLKRGQEEAVAEEQYETAGLLRDLIDEFQEASD